MSLGLVCVHSSLGALKETSNGHTLMYSYTSDPMEHCIRFAETLIKAVTKYTSIDIKNQIKFSSRHFSLNRFLSQWKQLLKQVK